MKGSDHIRFIPIDELVEYLNIKDSRSQEEFEQARNKVLNGEIKFPENITAEDITNNISAWLAILRLPLEGTDDDIMRHIAYADEPNLF